MTGLYTVSSGNVIQSQDINQLVTAFPFFNVTSYGAAVDGATNDSAAINSAIAAAGAAGGGIVFIPGIAAVASPINLNVSNVVLIGNGIGSGLRPLASFSGAQIVNITADFCGVRDMMIAYSASPYSGSPAADGIGINGANNVTLENVHFKYINGYVVNCVSPSTRANFWPQFVNVHSYQCKQGIHLLGHTNSGFDQGASLSRCIMDQVQNGNAYFFEDVHDVTCDNIEGSVSAGSGYTLQIKGAAAAIYINGFDLGPAPGPATSATVEIESGANGTPRQITLEGGVIEGGNTGVAIVAGTEIRLIGVDFFNNGTHGADISGGDMIVLSGCSFYQNGATAGSGHYDMNIHPSSGHVDVANCTFRTPQGTGTQQVANVINSTAGTVEVHDCIFSGTGFTASNIFNSFPTYIRNNPGYNPVGNISVSVPASNTNFTTQSSDLTYYGTGGTVTAIKVGGTATGLTSGSFRVAAQQTFSITYSVVPTVNAFAD